jgi:hypothetical protein
METATCPSLAEMSSFPLLASMRRSTGLDPAPALPVSTRATKVASVSAGRVMARAPAEDGRLAAAGAARAPVNATDISTQAVVIRGLMLIPSRV